VHTNRWSETEVGQLERCGMNGRLNVRVAIGIIWLAAVSIVVKDLG
jgi:hypothetical protein